MGDTISANPMIIFALLLALAVPAFFIGSYIHAKRNQKKQYEELEDDEIDITIEEHSVRVVQMNCGSSVYGNKNPKHMMEFYVKFLCDDGQEFEFYVEEEVYLSINKNQTGTLATVNGSFYGFVPD